MKSIEDTYNIPAMERSFSNGEEYRIFLETCCERCTEYKTDDGLPTDDSCELEETIDMAWYECGEFPYSDLLDGGYCRVLCKHFHTDDDYLMREYYRMIGVKIPEQLTFDMLMGERT